MTMTDEEFREEYKPLRVPAHFESSGTMENKMIFALAQIGQGTANDVISEMEKLESNSLDEQKRVIVRTSLDKLYNQGHLTGAEMDGHVHYNFSKITRANEGVTDPELLAPGLD